MKVPYNVLLPCGRILFASRSARIFSFNLKDGTHLSSWKHPDAQKLGITSKLPAGGIGARSQSPQESEDQPPAKRQKCVDDSNGGAMDVDVPPSEDQKSGDENVPRKQKRAKQREQNGDSNLRKGGPGFPHVTHIVATTDGQYIVVVFGHDKSIWVFKHDLNGALTQLSHRPMPKRPSSVLISPDDKLIISADKFGDVYTLPLIPSSESPAPTPHPSVQKSFKPEASNLTVHSARNRKVLEQQLLSAAKAQDKSQEAQASSEKPSFEHTLILGHVSMLTAMILARKGERRYIVTADRDEHIRVSRYLPQAHVIESFCLGHGDFVNDLVIPATRPEILVSGGGDRELFVWEWESGRLLSKFDLLSHVVAAVGKSIETIAVSHLSSARIRHPDGTEGSVVLVTCERIPAIFILHLNAKNTLTHAQTISCQGNPIHLSHLSEEDGTFKGFVVCLDPSTDAENAPALTAFKLHEESFSPDATFQIQDLSLDSDEVDMSQEDVQKLLYGAEGLRKHQFEDWEPAKVKMQQGKAAQESSA